MTSSKQRLADALRAADADAVLIENAERGLYSDYESPLPLPIMQLVTDLTAHDLHALAERAKQGEFDGTKEEARAWADSPEGREAVRDFPGFG